MPGFITAQLPDPPDLSVPKGKGKSIAATILTLGVLVAAPTAAAGSFVNLDPTNHVPNPGWEVD